MKYFTTIILAIIFLLLAISTAVIPEATFPALAVLLAIPLVAYLESKS